MEGEGVDLGKEKGKLRCIHNAPICFRTVGLHRTMLFAHPLTVNMSPLASQSGVAWL